MGLEMQREGVQCSSLCSSSSEGEDNSGIGYIQIKNSEAKCQHSKTGTHRRTYGSKFNR